MGPRWGETYPKLIPARRGVGGRERTRVEKKESTPRIYMAIFLIEDPVVPFERDASTVFDTVHRP